MKPTLWHNLSIDVDIVRSDLIRVNAIHVHVRKERKIEAYKEFDDLDEAFGFVRAEVQKVLDAYIEETRTSEQSSQE